MAESSERKASRHLSQIRFHQQFILKANPKNGRPDPIRVTYADCDYRGQEALPSSSDPASRVDAGSGPVLLFIGGMFGTRYLSTGSTDALARKYRLHVIVPDNFGLGGTANVPLECRVKSFIDLIRELLAHLDVKFVSMASHSAGTIYVLNAVLELRNLLHPRNPFVCLLAPWVHPSHSGKLQSLALVPDAILGRWDKIAGLIGNATSSFKSSSPQLISYSRSIGILASPPNQDSAKSTVDDEYDATIDYAPLERTERELENLVRQYMFAENTRGATEDAFLCLKRSSNATWGRFEDFDEAISEISRAESANLIEPEQPRALTMDDSSEPLDRGRKLRVQVYFAESDSLVGKNGQEWIDDLWRRSSDLDSSIIYNSKVVAGSGHDTIFDAKFGALDDLFASVRQLWTS